MDDLEQVAVIFPGIHPCRFFLTDSTSPPLLPPKTVTPLRRSQVLRKPDTASAAGTTAVELFAPSAKPTAMYKSPAPSAVMEMLDVTPARTGRKRDGTQSTQSSRPYRRAAAAERSSAVAAPATALGTMVSKDKVAAMRQQYSITPLRPMNHD